MQKNLFRFAIFLVLVGAFIACSSEKTIYVTITPKSNNFGQVNISENATFDFIVTNKKKVDVTLTVISFTTGEFSEVTGALGQTVLANKGTRTLTVRFTPAMPGGAKTDTMHIEWTDANGKTGEIDVKLDGEAVPVPKIDVTPTSKDFGNVMTNTTDTQNFTVENTGTADLTVFAPSLSGAAAAMYAITAGGAGGTLTPGNTLTITVDFTPTSDGNKVATLEIPHDGINAATPVTVNLEGIGVSPMIACTPNPLDFGQVKVGGVDVQNVTVDNAGSGNLEVTAINITGANAAEFVLMAALPINVAAGASTQVPFMFVPTVVGQRGPVTASFVNNTGTPEDVTLNGEGIPDPPGNGSNDYTFSQFTRAMTRISSPSNVYTSSMDDGSVRRNIGFTFYYWGTPRTSFYANSNGGIKFDGSYTRLSNYAFPYNNSQYYNVIDGWHDDLYFRYPTSRWYDKTTGVAPNRVYTIEYFQFYRYSSNPYCTFQIKLFETTNVIEMHYSSATNWYTGFSSTIGINSNNGTRGHSVSGSPNLRTLPTHNYRYTPKVTNPLPNKAASPSPANSATGIPAGGTNLSWTSNGTQYDVYLDTANPPLQVLANNHATSSIATGALSAGTTYYWRVISKNANGNVLGDVWSFTTN